VKINSSLLLVLCLVYQISIGQTPAERMLRGTIRVDATHASGISILNLSTDKSTTNQDGEFVNGPTKTHKHQPLVTVVLELQTPN
jgi:hypothetical protein